MAEENAERLDEALVRLLVAWINTPDWDESRAFLIQHRDQLLTQAAIATLDHMLLMERLGEEEEEEAANRLRMLLMHQTLLKKGREESIEAAYAPLLQPQNPLAQALQALPEQFRTALEAMLGASSSNELLEQIQQYPLLLSSEAFNTLEQLINHFRQVGEVRGATMLEERYATLKNVRQAIDQNNQSLQDAAIEAFARAGTSAELQQAVNAYPLLLEEATITTIAEAIGRAETQGNQSAAQTLRLRLQELQRLRLRQTPVRPLEPEPAWESQPQDTARIDINAHDHGIAAQNIGTVNQTNYDIKDYTPPEQRWKQPPRQSPPRNFIGREAQLKNLLELLARGENLGITARSSDASLQGMGGIGKTFMALKLADALYPKFPGGIIRVDLGPQIKDETGARTLLPQLARWAYGGEVPLASQLEPEVIKGLLEEGSGGKPMLVIFDDAWQAEPLLFLNRALPHNATRLVTTRFAEVVGRLGGHIEPLDRLEESDALALLRDRRAWLADPKHEKTLLELIRLLDRHPLALDIVVARLNNPARLSPVLETLKASLGEGRFENLKLGQGRQDQIEGRETSVEISLNLSYKDMTPDLQRYFRLLGVFAVETPLTPQAAAAIWGLATPEEAEEILFNLNDLALLVENPAEAELTFRQHGLLRAYALGLLDKEGELTSACWRHAYFYQQMAREVGQTKPKDYPRLDRHFQNLLAALEWSSKTEPDLFTKLVDNIDQFLHLRGQNNLLRDYLPLAIKISRELGNSQRQANALRSLGDLESRLGNVGQARTHYEAALPLYDKEQDRLGTANTLRSLGDLESRLGNVGQART
ncbi:MAG: tetratricopeptide repeat protein, partial [Chloroflexi bacterium]|nr:tetratricopeptide repeat protein [Chloroflexota bacterium]